MSYVDAYYDRTRDTIRVVERVNGERRFVEHAPDHCFYYTHPSGSHRSIFGDPCKKYSSTSSRKFRKELMTAKANARMKVFESDIRPTFRSLSDHYKGAASPTLNVCFFDIETDWHPVLRYADPSDPFNAITAITLYLSHVNRLITLALCPPTLTMAEADAICSQFPDTIVFDDERDMLRAFIDLIEDSDVLSGWNSESYDIPYTVNRIRRILSEDHARKLCLWNQSPREREYMHFGKAAITFDLIGRVHLDYLLLYKKHVTQQRHSYKLDFIGEIEVGERKVPYEGTLDDLYKKEFKKFIEYSRQDVMLLYRIDQKLRYIELHNQVAHANCVDLKTTMGSVALVETAIINEMHDMGLVVPDRKERVELADMLHSTGEQGDFHDDDDDNGVIGGRTPVVGAYVVKPKKGLHEHLAGIDINSLYPSVIRALNMSPETIIGQLVPEETQRIIAERAALLGKSKKAEAWEGVFSSFEYGHMMARDAAPITIKYEDGRTREMCGWQLHDYIFNPKNHLCITANGTIFRTDKEGIIPALLARWYADRKKMQGLSKAFKAIAEGKGRPDGFKNDADLIEIGGALIVADGDWFKAADDEYLPAIKALAQLYDQRQLARKILLNSLYGALLNEALRFYDERLGQSVTMTGRMIGRHMGAKTNEVVAGEYDPIGEAIIYGDTDSVYFSAVPTIKRKPDDFEGFEATKENFIALYDGVADMVNDSFAEFMDKQFNTGLERGAIIKAGRELVASRGLFIKKKKYAVMIYDYEGDRTDTNGKPGKLKAMGLDLKRADTPKMMQDFLSEVLTDILTTGTKEDIFDKIRAFRKTFNALDSWEKGSPKAVKGYTAYSKRLERSRAMNATDRRRVTDEAKITIPGHVRASINWNALCETYGDRYATRITDGDRIVVCKLMTNAHNMTTVAYPFDEVYLPGWFKKLAFDDDAMENVIIDKKLSNLVDVLGWDLDETKPKPGIEYFTFH